MLQTAVCVVCQGGFRDWLYFTVVYVMLVFFSPSSSARLEHQVSPQTYQYQPYESSRFRLVPLFQILFRKQQI
jgi:hypothetical protein